MESNAGYRADIEHHRDGKKMYYRYADPDLSIAKMPYVTANPLKSPTKSQLRQLLPHVWIQSHPEAKLDASNQ